MSVYCDETGDQEWRFTGFYGESRRELRYRNWDLLKLLHTRNNIPWLCAVDFNEVLDAGEQFGGVGRSESQMNGFRDALNYVVLWTWDLLVSRTLGIIGRKGTTIFGLYWTVA